MTIINTYGGIAFLFIINLLCDLSSYHWIHEMFVSFFLDWDFKGSRYILCQLM
jgi:hypothetical protein